MTRILFSVLMAFGLLNGCSGAEEGISEIDIKTVNDHVKSFIAEVESLEGDTENGVYLYNDRKNKQYLYLNEHFLEDGKTFGDVDIQSDDNAVHIYLTDIPQNGEEAATYKLYKINLQADKEYLKVFKNGEETSFAIVGS